MNRQARLITLIFFISACVSIGFAQDKAHFISNEEVAAFVEKASELLIDRYVFEEIGEQVAAHIRERHSQGAYNDVTDTDEFANLMTSDMQSISKDKHMRVRLNRGAPGPGNESGPDRLMDQYNQQQRRRAENYGFRKVEILDGNIGYIDFRYFGPLTVASDRVEAAMNFLRYSDALIFDMRKNGGGNPRLIQLICSYLFDEKVHLNSLYWREGDRTVEFWTLDKINGERMPDVPVFVLTSDHTFSGAEEFTYNLKTRERATIIGETTGGGANPGGTFPITDQLNLFIPTGRAINPVTGINWEGTGVEPDIPVPAQEAFDKAREKAHVAAEEYRSARGKTAQQLVRNLQAASADAEKLLAADQYKQAKERISMAFDAAREQQILDEQSINSFGYQYLGQDKFEFAILIFMYNVEAYPDAFNTYDSLGEAYMKSGQRELAVFNYTKSLELNPENDNAQRMLEKLRLQ
jgi:tetratricopeptide (TPR) repeat protein